MLPLRESAELVANFFVSFAELRDAGVAMHTLSNYAPWYRQIEQRLGLSRYLPWTFVSCETGSRKPEPQALQVATAA